ncbi:hypothetical protein Rhopal_005242-T1 [Rhodotorula paludigena]|uniref:SET domain-containing protein n=1 Tax=Rhodotorula paludigena TaxID=86838 RepID=A0AAV5GT59_9BASI|nr:hypothetical protein Rhopal_005242-T1 [Rhodotorula paludigena]
MNAADVESFLRLAQSTGVPQAEIDRVRRDPEALRELVEMMSDAKQSSERIAMSAPTMPAGEKADHMIAHVEAARAAYQREKHAPLRFPPASNRREILAMAEQMRFASGQRLSSVHGQYQALWTFTGLDKSSCLKPVEELEPIRFKDMQATKTHKVGQGSHSCSPVTMRFVLILSSTQGKYLLCRIISGPTYILGMTVVVEDQDGRATGQDLDTLFPLGGILLIREPTFKPNQNATSYLVRVESPTDWELLRTDAPLLNGVTWATKAPYTPIPPKRDYKALGNKFFGEKKNLLAVQAYTDGLAQKDASDEVRLVLFANRCQANLNLRNWASAYHDASAVLDYIANDVSAAPTAAMKAMSRRATALEGMRLLTRAREEYHRTTIIMDKAEAAEQGRDRVDRMLRESKTGDYDWTAIEGWTYKEDGSNGHGPIVGDFFGPIEVAPIASRGGGRGVVATRDIQAGELLLVEKAFAVGRGSKTRTILSFNFRTNTVSDPSKLGLITAVAAKLKDDPALGARLYALHGEPNYPPTGSIAFPPLQDRPLDTPTAPVYADINRIEEIVSTNSFGLGKTDFDDKTAKMMGLDGSGLFLGASMFNHSCEPSAMWRCFGDVQVIRARAPIKAGEEIFISYAPVNVHPKERTEMLSSHFADGCKCAYCETERTDSPSSRRRREQLLQDGSLYSRTRNSLVGKVSPSYAAIERETRIVKSTATQIEETYSSKRGPFRPELVEPYHVLGELTPPREANDWDLKALIAAGAVIEQSPASIDVLAAPVAAREEAVMIVLNIASRHASLKQDDLARRWIRAAQQMSRIQHGDDFVRFRDRHSGDIKRFNLDKLVAMCKP